MVLAGQVRRAFVVGLLGGVALSLAILGASRARADNGDDARAILQAMSDYVSSQKSIAATFNSDIEVITPERQEIQFDSSGHLQLNSPDKLPVSRTGGYTDVELFFDGKSFVVDNNKENMFNQVDASGSLDQLIEKIRRELGVDLPRADLVHSNPYQVLSADVLDGAKKVEFDSLSAIDEVPPGVIEGSKR
jgi:hypothetical protein